MNLIQIIAIVAICMVLLSLWAFALKHPATKPTQFSPTQADRYRLFLAFEELAKRRAAKRQSSKSPRRNNV